MCFPFSLLRALYFTSQSNSLAEEHWNRSAEGGHTWKTVIQSPSTLFSDHAPQADKENLGYQTLSVSFLMEEAPRRQFPSILKAGTEDAYTVCGIVLELWNIMAFILKQG